MRARFVAAAGLVLGFAALSQADSRATVSPRPPEKAALERLNLRTEWTVHLPVQWERDSITLVQIFGDQLFVQTRTGRLIAMDATNGRVQWSTSLGNDDFTNTYAVAVNSRFVFAVNVTTLHSFHRYTGLTEFVYDMGTTPTAGLSADEDKLYAVLATKPGHGGASRLEVYQLPRPIPIPVTTPVKAGNDAAAAAARNNPPPNPVDEMIRRYPTSGIPRTDLPEPEPARRPTLRTIPPGGYAGQPSPSLAVLPTVVPPYIRESGVGTPSLTTLPTLRQPYRLYGAEGHSIQQSPSVTVIPPSMVASLALSDLRPKGVQPRKLLEVALTDRILYPLLLTPLRAWAVTNHDLLVAVSTKDRKREVEHTTSAAVSAAPAQSNDLGYFPLADGNLLAIDLTAGNVVGGANVMWRAVVGGLMNHPPLVTRDAVYASGDNSGVARVDRKTGKVLWQSENPADTVLAANHDFAYIRNRQGRLLIYDVRKNLDPELGDVRPLTGMDLPQFMVPFTNSVTDRLYLIAENGLIVCLRDASPKYARPVRMAPEPPAPPPKKKDVDPSVAPPMPPAP